MTRIERARRAAGVLSLAGAIAWGISPAARAQAWSGAGADSNWSTAGNWIGGVAPVSGNSTIVTFTPPMVGIFSTVDAPFTLNRLELLGGLPFTLGGSAISFDGASPRLVVAGPYAVANDLSFLATTTIDSSVSHSLTGQVAGPAGLTKVGIGRLTLAGSFLTWGGPTTVSAGTLQIGNGVSGPNFFVSPMVVDGEVDFAGAPPGITVASSLSGTGTVTVSGGSTAGMGPAWTHQGPTNITGGTLAAQINSPGRLTVTGTGVLQTGDSAFGSLSDGAIPGTGSVFSNATAITIGSDNTSTTFSGTLAGAGGLTKVGSGRLTLASSPLTWGGPTTVSAGTLQIGNGVSGPNFFVSPMVVDGEVDFAGAPPGITVASSLSGTGSVTVSGGSTAGMGPAWTHQGPTNITGGTLAAQINSPGRLTVTGTGVLQTGDSSFGSLADGAIPGTGSVFSNATAITLGSDNTSTTFSGTIGGAGGLTKVGTGTFTIGGAALAMTGPLTVNGGRVNLLATGAGAAIVNGGGTLGGTGTLAGPVTVNPGGTLAPGLSPGTINTGNLNVAGTLAAEILGTTAGTQYDVVNVTGTVTLSGTLSLSGAYVPALGDVFTIVSNDGADAVTGTFAGLPEGATVLFNGATLRVSYVGGTGNDITLTAVSTTNVTWGGAGADNNWSTGANWVSGVAPASGNTTFVTFPAASARFAPAVDAAWTVNRLDIASATAYVMTGSAITFAGAAPQLNTSGGTHSLANAITLSAALAVANASNLTLSGAIGGAVGLTKTGAGRLALSGTSTFTGGTTVSGGTLLVNGTIPGPVVVNAGATLGGTGTVSGPVTINGSGTLSPGLSPGVTNTGNLLINGVLLQEIEGTTAGTQYDVTNVTGTVTIAGGTLTLAGAYVPVPGNTFTIVANDGADAVAGTFAGLAEGATIPFNGVTLQITYAGGTGNDIVLTALAAAPAAAAIPTLSEWALLLLAVLFAATGAIAARRTR